MIQPKAIARCILAAWAGLSATAFAQQDSTDQPLYLIAPIVDAEIDAMSVGSPVVFSTTTTPVRSSRRGGSTTLTAASTVAAAPVVDTERTTSSFLSQIRADAAYTQRITGRGVTVALLDTGITTTNAEFVNSGRILPGRNAINPALSAADGNGHGTHVAGLLAASRNSAGMFGTAYEATILPIKVLADNGGGTTSTLNRALRSLNGQAFIANISLGTSTQMDVGSLQGAVRSGLLMVVAAGNRGAANPDWPARYANESWANNQIIAVGAVDSSNKIASFSNRAGDAAAWYLVAPGVSLYSTYKGTYGTLSGTSMAAPIVSGAAALLKQNWPSLRADQVANILFVTATDLGTPGIDPIYGRGLVNIEKAMQPVGNVTTTTWNGRSVKVLSTSATTSPATAAVWALAVDQGFAVAGLDDYNRDYAVNPAARLTPVAPLTLDSLFGAIDSRISFSERVLNDGSRLALVTDERQASLTLEGQQSAGMRDQRLAAFAWSAQTPSGLSFNLGAGGFAHHAFGAGALSASLMPTLPALGQIKALQNPYLGLVSQASYGAVGWQGDGTTLRVGLLNSGSSTAMTQAQGGLAPANLVRSNATVLELGRNFGDAAVAATLTATQEQGAYLGSISSGVLAMAQKANTTSLQLSGALRLTDKVALAGQVALGYTPGYQGADQVITGMSALKTQAFGLALVAVDQAQRGDRFSLSLSQPMRTYAGSVQVNALAGLDYDGNPVREERKLSMVPGGRELLAEASYLVPVARDASLGFSLAMRHQPMHRTDLPRETLGAVRYTLKF